MDFTKYCIFIGTTRGNLLYLSQKPENVKFTKQDNASEVTTLCSGRSQEELVIGYENGEVKLYDCLNNKYKKILKGLEGDGSITGVACINNRFIIGQHDGVVNICKKKENNFFSLNLDEQGTLGKLKLNEYRENIVGTGGAHNDFKLWNIETQQCVFKAKSLGQDKLQLAIPTSIRDIGFFPCDPFLSVCATKEGYVLLYDDRAQRKPVVKILERKASYTCVTTTVKDRTCFVGTTKGYMQILDMKAGKCLKTFTNFTGAVCDIACDAIDPIVTTACLDRYLRVHNYETKELLNKCYMKQNLTKLLIKPIIKDERLENQEDGIDTVVDEEFEEIFNTMEQVNSDKKLKMKKRKMFVNPVSRKKVKKIQH